MQAMRYGLLTLALLLLALPQTGTASAAMSASRHSQTALPDLTFAAFKAQQNNNNNNNKQSNDGDHRRIGPGHCPKGKSWNPVKKTCDLGVACPYLFAWDDDSKSWIGHRKVITNARGRDKQLTDIVDLDKPSYRFRLRELEQEISFIDQVRLVLTLADGREVNVEPKRSDVASADGTYKKLYPGKSVEITFSLPKDVTAKDVKHSRLAVTGYYVVINGSLSN